MTKRKKIIVICAFLLISFIIPNKVKAKESASVKYQTHVQDIGWQTQVKDGEIAGTEGQSKRLEAIKIELKNLENIKIKYQTHIEDIGWQNWKYNGELTGTESQSKRLEAIKIELEYSEEYSIMYRVHIQDIGWQEWKYDGEVAGTEGQSKRVEAIEIKLVDKSVFKVAYISHVEDVGWQNWRYDGETAGTEGQSKRMEAIQIGFSNAPDGAKMRYKVHIQDIGWQDWKSDGQVAGTEGKSKRIEAIQIELENLEDYTIEYKVHIQDIGWTNWYRDGEMAGTVGKGLRIEGIKIRIVSKYKKHYIGIDVSHWQGDINYEKLVASKKIDFMITKVGWYSENNKRFIVDSKFEKNYKLAKQNKIPLGIYLYSYAKNVEDAKLEANELIKYLKSSGNSSFELPIFYDIEEDSQISYGKKAITDITIAFCETMKNAGYEVGVYSYSYWLNNYMEILRLPADYSLWGADYGTNNNGQIPSDLDKYSKTYDIWQFTDKAQIDGINGYVDMNVCYKKYF